MWSSAEITKANSEEIKEFLTTQQAVLTESYTGPDAQALDRSIVAVCGRDAPDEELLRLRYQAFGIWSATKSLAPSTFGTYVNCLHTGWMACIDARNRKPENINDPWDYAAHPLEKVTTILCDYIAPKLIANKAASELLSNFGTHISAIDMLRQAQLGVPHVKQELRAHPVIKAAMEELRTAKKRRGSDVDRDLAKRRKSKYFTREDFRQYYDDCIARCDYHAAASLAVLCATGLRKGQIPQISLKGCFLEKIEAFPFDVQTMQFAFYDNVKDRTHEGRDMVSATIPGLDALYCVPGFLAEKYIADGLGGNKLDIVDLIKNRPEVFKRMSLLYQDPAHPEEWDDEGQGTFNAVKRAQQRAGIYKKNFVTKAGRVHTAQAASMRGIPYEEISLHQGWQAQGAMQGSYLARRAVSTLRCYLAAGGFDGDRRRHFSYRHDIAVLEAWVDAVFPGVRQYIAELLLIPEEDRPIGAVGALESLLFLGEVFWRNLPVKVHHYQNKYNIIMFPAIRNITLTPEYEVFKREILHADRLSKAAYKTAGSGVPLELAAACLPEEKTVDAAIRKVMPQNNLKTVIDFGEIKTMHEFWEAWVSLSHRYQEVDGKKVKPLRDEKSRAEALKNLITWKAAELGESRAVDVVQEMLAEVESLAGGKVPMSAFATAVRAILIAGKIVTPKRKQSKKTNFKVANISGVLYTQVASLMGVELPPSCFDN